MGVGRWQSARAAVNRRSPGLDGWPFMRRAPARAAGVPGGADRAVEVEGLLQRPARLTAHRRPRQLGGRAAPGFAATARAPRSTRPGARRVESGLDLGAGDDVSSPAGPRPARAAPAPRCSSIHRRAPARCLRAPRRRPRSVGQAPGAPPRGRPAPAEGARVPLGDPERWWHSRGELQDTVDALLPLLGVDAGAGFSGSGHAEELEDDGSTSRNPSSSGEQPAGDPVAGRRGSSSRSVDPVVRRATSPAWAASGSPSRARRRGPRGRGLPRARQLSTNSAHRRDLPVPASATTPTDLTASRCASAERGLQRAHVGGRCRRSGEPARAPSKRVRNDPPPRDDRARTGSLTPLTGSGPDPGAAKYPLDEPRRVLPRGRCAPARRAPPCVARGRRHVPLGRVLHAQVLADLARLRPRPS